MIRKLALASALAIAVVGIAWAANAPTYQDPAGTTRDAQGVVLIDKDTNQPYNAGTGGGGSAGTEYTEDAAAAANPVGGIIIARRKDTLSTSEVSATGDNIALNATSKGELHTADTDTLAALATANAHLDAIETASEDTNPASVTIASTDPLIGPVTETAPATDTASSGLNGRLQRVAQRLTSLIALLPSSIGAKTAAGSLSVALPTDASFGSVATLTRPATTPAYSANDVVLDTGGSPLSFTLAAGAGDYTLTCASLEIDAASIISGETTYTLYIYNVTPPSALADDAAWDLPSGDRASFLGSINLGTPADLGSTLYVEQCNLNKQITTASANVFGYLVTTGAHTSTASRVYKIALHSVKAY